MKKTWLLVALLLLPFSLAAKTTTIYHTSDVHGFFYPKNGQGGFAALAAVLKSGPQSYLLLDSGDFANGTVETRNSQGLKGVQMMNRMSYDAATIGNHEFDFKGEGVAPLLANAQFAVLAANFFETATGKYPPSVLPYKIFDENGVKVAIIGLANREPTNPSKKYTFGKPMAALENRASSVTSLPNHAGGWKASAASRLGNSTSRKASPEKAPENRSISAVRPSSRGIS